LLVIRVSGLISISGSFLVTGGEPIHSDRESRRVFLDREPSFFGDVDEDMTSLIRVAEIER
jgi:hypothetical protein